MALNCRTSTRYGLVILVTSNPENRDLMESKRKCKRIFYTSCAATNFLIQSEAELIRQVCRINQLMTQPLWCVVAKVESDCRRAQIALEKELISESEVFDPLFTMSEDALRAVSVDDVNESLGGYFVCTSHTLTVHLVWPLSLKKGNGPYLDPYAYKTTRKRQSNYVLHRCVAIDSCNVPIVSIPASSASGLVHGDQLALQLQRT